ncbi:MAG: O-antigen ligase family protein, partial [Armatimonadota bacterium]
SSFYMTVAKLKDKESIKKAVRVWLWSSAFIAFLGLYGYFGIKLGLPMANKFLIYDLSRIKSTFKEPIFYGFYLASVIPLLYSLILNKSYLLPRKYLYGFLAINLLAMFFTLSRATWVAVIITIVIISAVNLKFKSVKVKIAAVTVIILIVIMIASAIFVISARTATERFEKSVTNIFSGKDFSALARLDAMATAWAIFYEHPVLGGGFGNYYFLYQKYSPFYEILYTWDEWVHPDANNMYLTVMAESGLLGLAAVLSIFLTMFINIIKYLRICRDKYWDPFLKGYLGSIIFILIIYMFTSTLMYLFLWVMFGIIFAIQRQCMLAENTEAE